MSGEVEDDVNGRLVKLETDVAHIRVGLADVKTEIKELRREVMGEIEELRREVTSIKDALTAKLEALRVDMVMTKVWTMGMLAVILGVMAQGFHWL
jgi:F0F1-type ATP synthase membrane subunit b/b'